MKTRERVRTSCSAAEHISPVPQFTEKFIISPSRQQTADSNLSPGRRPFKKDRQIEPSPPHPPHRAPSANEPSKAKYSIKVSIWLGPRGPQPQSLLCVYNSRDR